MIKKKMQDALNKQINEELFSAYLYQSMAAFFEEKNLKGFSNWMNVQAKEELTHAMRIYDYLFERGGRVILQAIKAPANDWKSPLAAFEEAYKHEQHITGCINKLVDMAIGLSDHASNNMLQWFVAEQVEEEASVDEVVQNLKLVGDDGGGLFLIDQELGNRVFVPPAAEGDV
jgi:ferritin